MTSTSVVKPFGVRPEPTKSFPFSGIFEKLLFENLNDKKISQKEISSGLKMTSQFKRVELEVKV
jgi:hypothetical protein